MQNAVLADDFTAEPVADLLTRAVAQHGHRPALHFLGRNWTYAALAPWSTAPPGAYRIAASAPVRVSASACRNTPYYPIFYYAILKIGGTVVNFNPLYTERELAAQIADSGITLMVTLDLEAIYRKVANVAAAAKLTLIICPMTGILPPLKAVLFRLFKRRELAAIPSDPLHVPYRAVIANPAPPAPVAIDPARPSPCCNTPAAPPARQKAPCSPTPICPSTASRSAPIGPACRSAASALWPCCRFFHVFAMTAVLNYSVMVGAEIVMLPRFDLQQTLAAIAAARSLSSTPSQPSTPPSTPPWPPRRSTCPASASASRRCPAA